MEGIAMGFAQAREVEIPLRASRGSQVSDDMLAATQLCPDSEKSVRKRSPVET
jgi:hypothetical protein